MSGTSKVVRYDELVLIITNHVDTRVSVGKNQPNLIGVLDLVEVKTVHKPRIPDQEYRSPEAPAVFFDPACGVTSYGGHYVVRRSVLNPRTIDNCARCWP